MAHNLNTAIANLQALWLTVQGTDADGNAKSVAAAPTNPTETNMVFPFAVTYERQGDPVFESDWIKDVAILYSELHVARVLLPQAIALAMSFRDPFQKALFKDTTLGGQIATVVNVRRTFGGLMWGGIETIGYRWEITCKLMLDPNA